MLEQDLGTSVRNSAIPLGFANSGWDDVLGVVCNLHSPRLVSGLQLGPQPVAQAAAIPGCAVALMAWGSLARAGRGR
jgi:hypothetical protein